jgi:hypothetical protein
MKAVLKNLLLLFLGACVGGLIVQARYEADLAATDSRSPAPASNPAGGESEPTPAGSDEEAEATPAVTVYYFHGDKRCSTCNAIEQVTREALQERFADELASGRLRWRVLNRQAPANRALAERFDLATNSVIVERHAGEPSWHNLEAIWDCINEAPAALAAYVQDEVAADLDAAEAAR